jgi:hypothetical protein
MINRYANYSGIKKVYVPEILSEYDAEVYNSLYYLSERLGFELLLYKNSLRIGDVLISRGIFEYNKMLHFLVDINYSQTNLLYLGIGYETGYKEHELRNLRTIATEEVYLPSWAYTFCKGYVDQ